MRIGRTEAALLLAVALVHGAAWGVQLQPLRGVVRVHSEFSTGTESVETITRQALAHHLNVVVMTDVDRLRFEYALPVMQRLLRFGYAGRSLMTRGTLDVYLAEIRRVRRMFPDLIIIDGVESVPFYFWEVDWRARRWTLHRWDQRLLAVGLGNASAYAGLPVAGGDALWIWNWRSLFLLWPVCGLLYAWLVAGRYPRWLYFGLAMLSILFLANNFPFKLPLWDASSGDLGARPYQAFIDYVRGRGGVVLWAGRESEPSQVSIPILGGAAEVVSSPSVGGGDLLATRGYVGFPVLGVDAAAVAEPGQEWDRVLREYLAGRRSQPVWGEGELDYAASPASAGNRIDRVQTVFLVRERSRRGVLESMAAGRMYAAQGGSAMLLLEGFQASSGADTVVSGGTLRARGYVRVDVSVARADGAAGSVELRLIKAGHVVQRIAATTPCEFHYVDPRIHSGTRTYYRLSARAGDARLISNPIFIQGETP